MVRLKLRTCSTNGISMIPSRYAQVVTSHSLIIVREFDLMQRRLNHSCVRCGFCSRRLQNPHLTPNTLSDPCSRRCNTATYIMYKGVVRLKGSIMSDLLFQRAGDREEYHEAF